MFYPLYQMQQHVSKSEHNDRNICTTYVHHGTNSGLEVNKIGPPSVDVKAQDLAKSLCSGARHFTLSVPFFN